MEKKKNKIKNHNDDVKKITYKNVLGAAVKRRHFSISKGLFNI